MAIANSIQFWTGILPNITLCLTSQSTGEPTPRKLFKSYFILLWLATATNRGEAEHRSAHQLRCRLRFHRLLSCSGESAKITAVLRRGPARYVVRSRALEYVVLSRALK